QHATTVFLQREVEERLVPVLRQRHSCQLPSFIVHDARTAAEPKQTVRPRFPSFRIAKLRFVFDSMLPFTSRSVNHARIVSRTRYLQRKKDIRGRQRMNHFQTPREADRTRRFGNRPSGAARGQPEGAHVLLWWVTIPQVAGGMLV